VPGTTVLANGETRDFGDWKIEAVPAYNLVRGPSAGQLFHPKGRGNGYVLTFGGKRFYFSGDTEGVPEMRALKNIDVAYVCMNLPYTMPPDEAAAAVRAFKPRVAIPYHYRGSDLAAFEKALAGSGVEVRIRNFYR
jgi:L-ascorbate metabolism protein UlaG (beta-lactamase superfamily)